MPKKFSNSLLAGIAALLLLQGCGGGGDGNDLSNTNVAPVANAGTAQSVTSGVTVTLNGSGTDSDGYITTYAWTQSGGTAVTLSGTSIAQPTFAAPLVSVVTTYTFSLVVADNRGSSSAAATVVVTVNPPPSVVVVTGLVRYAQVPFSTVTPFGLLYANATMQPARGVVVRALDATSMAELSSSDTTSAGTYSLNVPGNSNVIIQVVARMQRASTLPLPNWNVDVQNGATGTAYTYNTAAFNSSSSTQNIDIPLNIGSNGVATGTRYSGPFAILDVIYSEIQTVLAVSPTANLPALYVDWGPSQTTGTFYTGTTSSSARHIALMSDLTEDTDEFDTHVIAHEYGHYIEDSFSRSDNIGGSHALGDNLDPRVAWGEGWATAFGAIALNDPIYRDSYVDNGVSKGGGFSVEVNPLTTGVRYDGIGCWCNEASVYSMVWDLYDSAADGSDNVALGFAPIWAALTGPEKTTPAFTTIFSFIDALKKVDPDDVAAINTLVAAQNIDAANLDAFGTNETHSPLANMLPLYTSITKGGTAVTLHSSNDMGYENKLGDHRFLRFDAAATGTITVTATTSNTHTATTTVDDGDPDFIIYKAGNGFSGATGPGNSLHNDSVSNVAVTSGTTYLIDVYDCANGCSGADGTAASNNGTPGDYDLTTVIN